MSVSYRHFAVFAVVALAACPNDNGTDPNVVTPTVPSQPSGLTATALSSSSVMLGWTDGSDNEGAFKIERCTGASCSNFAHFQTAPVNATGYLDISVAGGTSYSYRVRAENAAGTSAFSSIATVVTPQAGAIPAPPTNLLATAVNSSRIDVTWTDASTTEDGFRIESCVGASCTNFTTLATTLTPNGVQFSHSWALASTTYRYRIQSYNGSGGSAFVGPVSATTPAAAAVPAPPSGLSATATSSSRIALAWTDHSSNEDGFKIERCQGAGCTDFTLLGTSPAGSTSFANTSLPASTTFRYRVQSYNGAGGSTFAGPADATTLAAVLLPPTGLGATAVSSSRIDLSWTDASTNEDGFRIERCQGSSCTNFAFLANAAANATSFVNSSLTPSTTYRYRVQAYNGGGSSGFAGPAAATTLPQATAPAAPSGLTATPVSSSRIDLTWADNSSNEDAFIIERCSGAGCSNFATLVTAGINSTSYSNTGLTASTSYSYRVQAVNTTGFSSFATATAVTPAALSAPTLNVPTVSGSSITLTWSFTWPGGLACSCDGYQLEESTTSSTTGFVQVHAPATRTTPYTHTLTNRAPGTYYYRVRAVTTQGTTPNSTARSAVVAAPPTAPTTLRIINDLPGGFIGGANWTQLNTVIRVRIGPTSTSVINFTAQARELLWPLDFTSDVDNTLAIPPGTQGTVDVSSQTGTYWVYIQTGWWEYFTETDTWEKHMAQVMACDGVNLAYKWVAFQVTAPFGAPELIRLSEFLPAGSYGDPFC